MRSTLGALLLGLLLPAATRAGGCPAGVDTASFQALGAFGIGARTLTLVDASRPTAAHGNVPAAPDRTLETEVWYPTTPGTDADQRDAPLAAGGPFPLVVNSPGLRDNRLGEAYYARHLASRGFVVASVQFPLTNTSIPVPDLTDLQHQPGDVRFVMDQLLALSTTAGSWLSGGIDARRIGVSGLSLGGATTLLVTYHRTLRDRRVRSALALAPAFGCATTRRFFGAARPPLLILQGDQDLLVPLETNAEKVFRLSRSPRQLVVLKDASHTGFAGPISFPSQVSYDTLLGCPAVAGVASWGDPYAGLGGSRVGFDTAGAQCALPCQGPAPTNPPMQATVQHDLTRAVAAAFFDATLKSSAGARCFLRHRLAQENAAVQVHTRAGR